ncbi:DnaD domain protein, partial [Thomasclavelia cocleata]|uniref:DnaD domain-containing protein n=1 Tax=Thomasclavelia cocleata TaxID=69824 RepID=UPI00272DE6CA
SFYKHTLLNNHYTEKQKEIFKPSGSSLNQKDKNNTLLNLVKTEFNIQLTKKYQNTLLALFKQFNTQVIQYAIEYTSLNATSPKQYLVRILENWGKANIQTVEQAKAYKTTAKVHRANKANESKEMTPQWLEDQDKTIRDDSISNSADNDEDLKEDREAFLKQLKERWRNE